MGPMQPGALVCDCMSLVFGKVVSGHASLHGLLNLRAWCQRSSFRELLMVEAINLTLPVSTPLPIGQLPQLLKVRITDLERRVPERPG